MSKPEESPSFQSFKKSPYFSMKWENYFAIYDQLFSLYRGREITFIEIGVLQGGSLFMWRDFLGPQARIIGIDLNPEAKRWEEYGFEIFIGDQSKSDFWKEFTKHVPNFDVLLDDGGHTNPQQLVTLVEMANIVNPGGLIVIEDTHSSYQKEYGNPGRQSFINVTKRLIDGLHNQFRDRGPSIHAFGGLISIEYFSSIIAFKFGENNLNSPSIINNEGISLGNSDFRYVNHCKALRTFQQIERVLSLNYHKVGQSRPYFRYFNSALRNSIARKTLKFLLFPFHRLTQLVITIFLKYETFRFLSKQKI